MKIEALKRGYILTFLSAFIMVYGIHRLQTKVSQNLKCV